jgi:N utilization substance protein B
LTDLYDLYFEEDDAPLPVKDERSLGRRIALQILYEVDLASHDLMQVVEMHQRRQNPSRRATRYMRQIVIGTWENRETADEAIRRYAPEYPLDQIAAIDRNILRIAIFEFAIGAVTPVGVAIDEAVELAKQFGSDASPGFVNGVLGSLADDEVMTEHIRKRQPAGDSNESESAQEERGQDDLET